MEAVMTETEKVYIKEICAFFYPSNPPAEVNDKLADVAGHMLNAAMEKSKALDLVPRPPLGAPGAGWVLLQAVQIFWRMQRKTRIYEVARVAVAWQYRTEYELARMGL
jgi:hypothetical protein